MMSGLKILMAEPSGDERSRRRRRGSIVGGEPKTQKTDVRWRRRGAPSERMWVWLTVILVVSVHSSEAFISSRVTFAQGSVSKLSDVVFGVSCDSFRQRQSRPRRRLCMMDHNGEEQHIQNGKQHEQSENIIPRHVAFICDGNSRWAQARGLPASAGHYMGADQLISCLHTLKRTGVEFCTFYGFSTENWKRSSKEIRDILFIMEQTARKFYDKAIQEGIRVKILGDLEDPRIPDGLRGILQKLENDTYRRDSTLTVCLGINYGGRRDMINASISLAKAIASGELTADDVTEDDFSSLLCTSGIPDPDLMIRTGGEKRLSNFLLFELCYSELYFSTALWPDFDDASILEALDWYSSRSRRFGGRKNNFEEPSVIASTSTNGAP